MIDIDYYICMGTGDYPSDSLRTEELKPSPITSKDIERFEQQGLVQDSTGSWFNPNRYIDRLYMDW